MLRPSHAFFGFPTAQPPLAACGRMLAVLLCLSGSAAAAAPAPALPAPAQDVRLAWGGETRQVFSRDVMNGSQLEHHTWAVGDGCIIRHRVTVDGQANGDWEIQDVPADVSQSLLDIYFLEDGVTGWACGSAGLLLDTTDGGETWSAQRLCATTLCSEQYPTLWRVRFVSEDEGYVCGLWTFMRTTDGGDTWADVDLEDDSEEKLNDRFEFYALEVVETEEGWIGVCAGQEWYGHCPSDILTTPSEGGGVVFYTDGTEVDGGEVWELVFCEEEYNAGSPAVVIDLNDPWDIAFEPDPAGLTEAVGYLCGGSGTTCGTILRTEDSGLTWSYEWGGGGCPDPSPGPNDPYTLYGIAALSDGRAVACGYGGQVMYRRHNPSNPPNIQWKKVLLDPPSGSSMTSFSGPLAGAAPAESENGDCTVVGCWGMIASATIPAISSSSTFVWTPENPNGAQGKQETNRFNDVYFRDPYAGLAVGQGQGIAQSLDGGETWSHLYGGPGSALTADPNLEAIAFKPDGLTGVAVGSCDTDGFAYKLTFNTGTGAWDAPDDVAMSSSSWRLKSVDYAEFNHFWAAGWEVQGSVVRPLILRSTNNGTSWSAFDLTTVDEDALPDGPPPDGLVFVDIAMLSARHGFAVGFIPGDLGTTDPDEPMVYKIFYDDNLAEYTFSDVTPYSLLPTDARFHGVATRGTNPTNGEIYIAGGPSLLLVWDNSVPGFVEASGISDCPESCESASEPTTCSLDFRSVALSPSGSLILVGLEGVPHEHVSHELGRMLRKTGASSPWEWIPGRSIKDCMATYLLSDTQGWVLAGGDNRGSILSQTEPDYWSRLDIDTEWGEVSDSAFLVYDPEE